MYGNMVIFPGCSLSQKLHRAVQGVWRDHHCPWLTGTRNAAPNALQVRERVIPLVVLQNSHDQQYLNQQVCNCKLI